jgi:hypothetical protein
MMRKWANFREISFCENFHFRKNVRFPGSFRENGYVSAINILKKDKFKRKFDDFREKRK